MREGKVLIIVDAQYDFINGSLAVNGAPEAMEQLTKFLSEHKNEYAAIILTMDWHPFGHSSFKPEGMWPPHCVQYTKGAAIYDGIINTLSSFTGDILFLQKGRELDKEAYSVFMDTDSSKTLQRFMSMFENNPVEVCGIAGDFCVLNTLKDFVKIYPKKDVSLLEPFTPCISPEGKKELTEFVTNNNIKLWQ